MDSLVVDNSIVIAWCFDDEKNDFARRVMYAAKGARLLVPSIWPLELGNTLLVAERRNRITKTQSERILADLAAMPIQVVPESLEYLLSETISLARKHQLSTYDASYLDLAMQREIPLATQDKALIRAAAECGVALFKP